MIKEIIEAINNVNEQAFFTYSTQVRFETMIDEVAKWRNTLPEDELKLFNQVSDFGKTNLDIIEEILKDKRFKNMPYKAGYFISLLHLKARSGTDKIGKLLLKYNADFSEGKYMALKSLAGPATKGNYELVLSILKKIGSPKMSDHDKAFFMSELTVNRRYTSKDNALLDKIYQAMKFKKFPLAFESQTAAKIKIIAWYHGDITDEKLSELVEQHPEYWSNKLYSVLKSKLYNKPLPPRVQEIYTQWLNS